jgi:phosphinothricin acetyltransferase
LNERKVTIQRANVPSGSVRVRRALEVDADVVAEIYTESIRARDSTMDTEPFTRRDVEVLLERLGKRDALFVLDHEDAVRGWGMVKSYSDRPGYRTACETSVYLRRSHLRRGFGRRLQDELHRFAEDAGYHHIVTKIWADNAGSIAFHAACGFSLVGIQREIGLVDGVRRDVAIMQRLL